MPHPRKWPAETREACRIDLEVHGKTIRAAAQDNGVPARTLSHWKQSEGWVTVAERDSPVSPRLDTAAHLRSLLCRRLATLAAAETYAERQLMSIELASAGEITIDEREQCVRIVALLTRTLREVRRLHALAVEDLKALIALASPPAPSTRSLSHDAEPDPADMDEIYQDLARAFQEVLGWEQPPDDAEAARRPAPSPPAGHLDRQGS